MSDTQPTALAAIAGAVRLSDPVKTSFLKAISELLGGLTAIPAAWLKRPAQAIEDTTAARSAVTAILAKAVADEAIKDPGIMQAAAEIYLPTTLRKARNRVNVAQCAAEHIADAATQGSQPAPPDDDWINTFMRFAEDASSERLQDLFGRILAGQVVRPGSFATATLRAVSELDQSIASDFSSVWMKSVGDRVDYAPEFQRGDGFSRWKRLSEAGLLATSSARQFLPPFNPIFNGAAVWSPMSAEGVLLTVFFQQGSNAGWDHIDFTRVGREIGSLLPRPDYEANIRRAAQRLPTAGIIRMELFSTGKPPEVIWQPAG